MNSAENTLGQEMVDAAASGNLREMYRLHCLHVCYLVNNGEPLKVATLNNQVEVVKFILTHYPFKEEVLEAISLAQNFEILKLLTNHLNFPTKNTSSWFEPLVVSEDRMVDAAVTDRIGDMVFLHSKGVSYHANNGEPLKSATLKNQVDVVKFILKQDPPKTHIYAAIRFAKMFEYNEILKLLNDKIQN